MPFRPLIALVLAGCCSCNCSNRLVPAWEDDGGLEGDDAGLVDGGTVTELPDAGALDAGRPDAGGADAGTADGGRPFELERALRDCERIESCMMGPSNYNGLTILNACVAILGRPMDDADHVNAVRNRLGLYFRPRRDLVYLDWLYLPEVQRCVREQTTCDGLLTCFNLGSPASPCDPQQPARCDGTRVVTCQAPSATYRTTRGLDGGYLTFSYDCAAEERVCAPSTTGAVGCAPSQCPLGTAPRCDGNTAQRCFDGLVDTLPCPDGTSCFLRSPPDALCRGSGGTCNLPATSSHCDGARQVSCQFGAWATTDCGPGLSCHTAPNNIGFCGVAGECDPSEAVATCDAATRTLRVCAMGRWVNVDCADLGFSGCVDATLNHPALCR